MITLLIKYISFIAFIWHYYSILFLCFVKNIFFGWRDGQEIDDKINVNSALNQSYINQNVQEDIKKLISLDGYTFQIHHFETDDKVYVTCWRIKASYHSNPKQYPVIIQHGLLDCSVSWFMHKQKKNCLPYVLAEQGYDVWLGNNRGTKYSQYPHERQNYWQYSFDDFVSYDQPTLIKGVINKTGCEQIIYIGHSQGSTQFLLAMDSYPSLREKILLFIGLGTIMSIAHLKNHYIIKFVSFFYVLQIFSYIGFKNIFFLPNWISQAFGVLISKIKIYRSIIMAFINSLCGTPKNNKINIAYLGIIASYQPGGTSIRTIQQWINSYRQHKNLCYYDYGQYSNKKIYGQQKPPEYSLQHLKNLPFNTYIFKGTKDAILTCHLNSDKTQIYEVVDYAHLDYVWGITAKQYIYDHIVKIFNKEIKKKQRQ